MVASGRGAKRRLFDRSTDPRERRNVASDRSDDAERLWNQVIDDAGGKTLPRYD
jgi:hypothetical protein